MIELKDIAFSEKEIRWHSRLVGKDIIGRLDIRCVRRLDEFDLSHSKADCVGYTKQQITNQIWHKIYGALYDPLDELRISAIRNAMPGVGSEEVRRLAGKLWDMISDPK